MILLVQGGGTSPDVPDDGGGGDADFAPGLVLSWWVPWLDRTWDLSETLSPLFHIRGATSLGPADTAHRWADSPTIDGSSWSGARVERLPVSLPLMVAADSTDDFLAEHTAFAAACDPYRESVLRVSRPDGALRELDCRYMAGLNAATDQDPVALRTATYVVEWEAADPFWRGPEIVASFPYVAPQSFFPGPPWDLAPNRSLSSAQIANPGDVDSFPVWRVDGPAASFSVGVGDAVVDFGAALTAGQWVEIDMSPGKKTIIDHTGADRWDSVTDWNDSPIPPGKSDLVTSLVTAGAGSNATLTFTPRYRAAW